MFEIKNLHATIEGKEILKGIALILKKGTVNVIMGPNGSGKSTLAKTLMGYPTVKASGSILLDKKEIISLKTHERSRRGLFLGFQNPIEVPGVTIMNLLRTVYNTTKEKKLSILEFKKLVEEKAKSINMNTSFLSRSLNDGFSGGEKKKAEILQLLVIDPTVAILDEPDSGLDIDALKEISKGINAYMTKEKILIIITHYKRILDYIKADRVFIMKSGRIVKEGNSQIVEELEKKGYEGIEK